MKRWKMIGIDGGALSIADDRLKVGVYRVTLNLLKQLARIDTKNIYRLYGFRPTRQGILRELGGRLEHVVLPKFGWFTIWLPRELRRRPVDIFLGLSQALPSPPPRTRTIGFIYDVGFLYRPQDYPGFLRKLTKQTKELAARADHIMTVSRASALDIMTHYHVPKEKITVAYPGVDQRFTPQGVTMKRDHPYFLFVGSLKPGKNVVGILRAFALFLKNFQKPYDLLLVGSNFWFDNAITQTIAELGIGPRVRHIGFVPDDELPVYYRGATAFVSPSHREGFCLPAIEAQASGCPVVVSNTGVFPEVIGKSGLLVDPMDTDALAQALFRIPSRALRTKLISSGYKNVKRFSWKYFAQEVLHVINTL